MKGCLHLYGTYVGFVSQNHVIFDSIDYMFWNFKTVKHIFFFIHLLMMFPDCLIEIQKLLASARTGTLTSDTEQKSMPQKHARSLQAENLEAQLDTLRKELKFKSDELVLTQENCKKLASEK